MIHLCSLSTKVFRRHRPLLKEIPWPRCRPLEHRVTTAILLSDSALRSHRTKEKSKSGMYTVVLFYLRENCHSFSSVL